MQPKALLVGGCPAPYHRMEPAEGPIRSALEEAGLLVTASGIYHPDGGDAWTGDYSALREETLRGCAAAVLYTTGTERHGADVDALVRFVRQGGALIGIHNAADTFTDHPEFVSLIGGRFRTHPAPLEVTVEIVDAAHPITSGLQPFTVLEELYLFADYDPARVHLLAQTSSYDDDGPVPVCWVREEGAGRVFYVSLGHFPETLAHAAWRDLFRRGVQWAVRG